VDATAQQALLDGLEEYSRGRSGCGSRCISGTGLFKKTPSFFFWFLVTLKWLKLCNRLFWKYLNNIKGVVLDAEADATAEQVFLKRRLHFLGGFWSP
jgi:hypothetical protein